MKSVGLLVALSALTFVWSTPAVQAAGLAGGTQAIGAILATDTIQKVHGCHRHYSQGIQGWHRHGSDCSLRRDLADSKRRKKI
jgi:hypothetical protein